MHKACSSLHVKLASSTPMEVMGILILDVRNSNYPAKNDWLIVQVCVESVHHQCTCYTSCAIYEETSISKERDKAQLLAGRQ